MKVLCVAEKPSIAKSITEILSGGRWDTVSHLRRQAEGKAPECPECSSERGVVRRSRMALEEDAAQTLEIWSYLIFLVKLEADSSAQQRSPIHPKL